MSEKWKLTINLIKSHCRVHYIHIDKLHFHNKKQTFQHTQHHSKEIHTISTNNNTMYHKHLQKTNTSLKKPCCDWFRPQPSNHRAWYCTDTFCCKQVILSSKSSRWYCRYLVDVSDGLTHSVVYHPVIKSRRSVPSAPLSGTGTDMTWHEYDHRLVGKKTKCLLMINYLPFQHPLYLYLTNVCKRNCISFFWDDVTCHSKFV